MVTYWFLPYVHSTFWKYASKRVITLFVRPYPKLYTGGLVENTKVIRIIMLKELGKITS